MLSSVSFAKCLWLKTKQKQVLTESGVSVARLIDPHSESTASLSLFGRFAKRLAACEILCVRLVVLFLLLEGVFLSFLFFLMLLGSHSGNVTHILQPTARVQFHCAQLSPLEIEKTALKRRKRALKTTFNASFPRFA